MRNIGSIRVRLTIWYVLFLAVTVLGFSIYLHLELLESLINQVDAGLQVAASQLLVDVDDTVNPPTLRPMSMDAVDRLMQSRSALRLVTVDGDVVAEVGVFPDLPINKPGNSGVETITIDGTPWRVYTQRVETLTRQFDVWLQSAQSLNIIYDARTSLFRLIVIGLPITLIVAALGGTFMANRALRPVDTITRTADAINSTDMGRRVAYDGPGDELGRLTHTINSMLDRLQTAFDNERRFTADASHELRTPLTAIKGHIGVTLTRKRSIEEYETTLNHIQHETDRLIRLTNDLLFLARLDTAQAHWDFEAINLSDLLEAVIDQVRIKSEEKRIILRTSIPGHIPVQGTADHLIRLFLNILDNAVKYTPPNGEVHVLVDQSESDVCVTISDSGPGIAAEHLPHLFDRFYRVERDRFYSGGAGLGLAIALQIARQHGGTIQVESQLGRGTAFRVHFPQAPVPEL